MDILIQIIYGTRRTLDTTDTITPECSWDSQPSRRYITAITRIDFGLSMGMDPEETSATSADGGSCEAAEVDHGIEIITRIP